MTKYTKYCSTYVDEYGRAKGVDVPESCIDSTEQIMRNIYLIIKGQRPTRAKLSQLNLMAYFGGGVQFNASNELFMEKEFIDKKAPNGLTNYGFDMPASGEFSPRTGRIPMVGEGLILLNKTQENLDYNMHFGAIVARNNDGSQAIISNMYQVVRNFSTKTLNVLEIISPDDFCVKTFRDDASKYAIGILKIKTNLAMTL